MAPDDLVVIGACNKLPYPLQAFIDMTAGPYTGVRQAIRCLPKVELTDVKLIEPDRVQVSIVVTPPPEFIALNLVVGGEPCES